jgi:Squalene-hopene cyclase C-terminal domain
VEAPNGTDWYRFEFSATGPKLVFFQIELMERDQLPVNVSVYLVKDGKLAEYTEGEDPVTLPHEVQALPGNKFTPRILKETGIYYVAVHASHPEYKLRTRVYDPPPYADAHLAVRTGLDYILAAGDSWHANTPRRGGILDRVASVHQETSLCVACHPTHFSQRAQLYALRNGYPVIQRQQLQFLSERFYNNPRPFYGFEEEGAVWARMISAPANVLGRMSHLMTIFEEQVTGETRPEFHEGISEYLKLYYAGRDKLPPDETNGNTPLVSAHEVAWYAWSVTKDPRLPEFIAAGEVKNMVDLCYQTLALADIDKGRYRPIIHDNVQRILALQRPDGQWSMRFEPGQPEVEFQTGHALWALQAAGVPADEPRVAKAIAYLLGRQQTFGGWMDPLQSFENFRTPFRETQMALLALSAYFAQPGRAHGWNSPLIDGLSGDPVRLLEQLDEVWDPPSASVRAQIVAAAQSNDALVRQAAVEALGRLGQTPDPALLGDSSKMVQRTAAWATRQAYSRHEDLPTSDLVHALGSANDRARWGATRIFAAHFAALARRPELSVALSGLIADPAASVRMNAVKGLWQFWFWNANPVVRDGIENTLLGALGTRQHPWVQENLRHAVYNLSDENIRYLYNNWVPLLGKPEDQERAVRGRLAVEALLADKFATVLEQGPALQKKELLLALTEQPLRRADAYDLDSDPTRPAPPVYSRIGNDIEQIAFFGESAARMSRALRPLLDSPDAEIRRAAERAVLMVRATPFAEANRIAGSSGEDTKQLIAKIEIMPEATDVALVLKPASVTSNVGAAVGPPRKKPQLDETFFRGYVQPILEKRGKDGSACVHCHATHTLFNATYGTALNVVDTEHPESSLILLKPTSSSETEGVVGSKTLAHGGGVRWPKDSPEYNTILKWIKGAKE